MSVRPAWVKAIFFLALAILVPACGGHKKGGSGGSTPTPGVIEFSLSNFGTAEGNGTVILTVTRTGGTADASVQFATGALADTATAGADYTAQTGTLSWVGADNTSRTITIDIADQDLAVEGDEFFTVTLSAATGDVIGPTGVATMTITDPDGPADGVFEFSAPVYTIVEGTGTVQATITVHRTTGSVGAVTVDVLLADGTTTSGVDYTAPGTNPVQLSWADGDAADKTVVLDILDDGPDGAGKETLNLTLQNPLPGGGPTVGTQATAVLEIIDRDAIGTFAFSAPSYSVSEAGVQQIITVQRLNGAQTAVTVEVNVTDGTAVAGTDYTAPTPNPVVLSWADGDVLDKTFTILITDNPTPNANKTVTLTLQNPSAGTITLPNPVTLTIVDDEAGVLSFSAATYSSNEGDTPGANSITVLVNRINGSSGAVTADVTVTGGTATLTTDYTLPGSPTLSWADGDSAPKPFVITIVGDTTFEPDETIILSLGNLTGGATPGAPTTATATIVNDDGPPGGTISIEFATYTVAEDVGTFNVNVVRTGALPGVAASCTIATANGTAKGNGKNKDYNKIAPTVVNFPAGVNSVLVPVTIVNDAIHELDETFKLSLTLPSANALLGTPKTTVVTISAND